MTRKSKRVPIAVLALAAGVAVAIPFSGATSAVAGDTTTVQIRTVLVAHSIVADINDTNVQANVPLRPSAHLYAKVDRARVPLAGQFVQFFAAGQGLCATKTNNLGYAECKGIVRLTYSLLALGSYEAKFPGTELYKKSSDTGQLLTLGSTSLLS